MQQAFWRNFDEFNEHFEDISGFSTGTYHHFFKEIFGKSANRKFESLYEYIF